jgi:hypothetical protein
MAEIPPLIIPVIPQTPIPPPTRGMVVPPTRGMTPPTALVPDLNAPTMNLPPTTFSNPDPGTPRGGSSQQQEEEPAEEEDTREMPAEVQMAPFDASTQIDFTVPIIEMPVSIPVPKPEVVITAGTTAMTAAVTATGAAIFAKPLFEQVMKLLKPVAKKIAAKLLGKKEKVYPESTPLQLPDQLRFEGARLTPSLSRQHRDRGKEKKGAKTPPSESSQYTSKP